THARQLPFVGSTQLEFQVQFAFRFLDQPAAKFYWICTHSHTCAWDAPDALRRIRSGRYTSAEEFDPQRRRALRDDHSPQRGARQALEFADRKSTRLNSSHVAISYAVFCLKKKNINWNFLG